VTRWLAGKIPDSTRSMEGTYLPTFNTRPVSVSLSQTISLETTRHSHSMPVLSRCTSVSNPRYKMEVVRLLHAHDRPPGYKVPYSRRISSRQGESVTYHPSTSLMPAYLSYGVLMSLRQEACLSTGHLPSLPDSQSPSVPRPGPPPPPH